MTVIEVFLIGTFTVLFRRYLPHRREQELKQCTGLQQVTRVVFIFNISVLKIPTLFSVL